MTQVVEQMDQAGLVELGTQAQDGMRVRASAGAASFRRQPTLEKVLAQAQVRKEEVERMGQAEPVFDTTCGFEGNTNKPTEQVDITRASSDGKPATMGTSDWKLGFPRGPKRTATGVLKGTVKQLQSCHARSRRGRNNLWFQLVWAQPDARHPYQLNHKAVCWHFLAWFACRSFRNSIFIAHFCMAVKSGQDHMLALKRTE